MGREAKVEYADANGRAQVKAHLDSAAIELTGGKKLKLPLASVKSATVDGDLLKIAAGATKFTLALGAKEAEAWRKKILNPPSLAEKLGIKPDKTVALIGAVPPEIADAADGQVRQQSREARQNHRRRHRRSHADAGQGSTTCG
jgi:hypothetical protein